MERLPRSVSDTCCVKTNLRRITFLALATSALAALVGPAANALVGTDVSIVAAAVPTR
jgi:hypothetical protein